jgi:hypothetical protein
MLNFIPGGASGVPSLAAERYAEKLIEIMEPATLGYVDPETFVEVFKAHWQEISALAHALHLAR